LLLTTHKRFNPETRRRNPLSLLKSSLFLVPKEFANDTVASRRKTESWLPSQVPQIKKRFHAPEDSGSLSISTANHDWFATAFFPGVAKNCCAFRKIR
jgi:hypothetical protein